MRFSTQLQSSYRTPLQKWGLRLTTGALFLATSSAFAQFQVNNQERAFYAKSKLGTIAREIRADGWIQFKDSFKEDPQRVATTYKAALGLGNNDELRLVESLKDEVEVTRYRYTQFHGKIPVEGTDFSIYATNGKAVSANGRLVPTLEGTSTNPGISEEEAFRLALAAVPAQQYDWQVKVHLRPGEVAATATKRPKGKLLYALTTADGNSTEARHQLAYRFDVMRIQPQGYDAVYIDAQTGKVLRTTSLLHKGSCQNNMVDTWYNGNLYVGTWWDSGRNRFQLKDFCRGGYIYTKYSDNYGIQPTEFANGYFIEASGAEWAPLNTNWNWDFKAKSAASAHWSVQAAHWFFQNRFGRNGMPNYNRDTRVVVNNLQDNAYYYDYNGADYIVIGRFASLDNRSMAETDIVAHEFTHGVVRSSAGLAPGGESNALNESFADIFGEMVERSNSPTPDWAMGGRVGITRSFAREAGPSYGIEPAQVYQGLGWDWSGEPHRNGGVQNRWFYLLSVGGAGSFSVPVAGIGQDKAARIAYRNLTRYLGPNSTYSDARNGSIQSAIDLFGACSDEVVSTTNAWAAVGVGAPAPQSCATEIAGTPQFCIENGQFVNATYSVQASAGATKDWYNSNSAFDFSGLGRADYVTLNQVPGYEDFTTLSVYIQYPNNPGANTWRYFDISSQFCRVQCKICPEEYRPSAGVLSGNRDITVYPNPADATATVELRTLAETTTTVRLSDMLGRSVHVQTVPAGARIVTLDVAKLPIGSYVLSVTTASGTTTSRLHIRR